MNYLYATLSGIILIITACIGISYCDITIRHAFENDKEVKGYTTHRAPHLKIDFNK